MQTEHSIPGNPDSNLPLITCRTCNLTWLTPGLVAGDKYECKNCGSSFIIRRISENPGSRTANHPDRNRVFA
jgi:hypothetical protein